MSVPFVAYFRVSTAKQGASGLGLQAQRQAVREYVQRHGGELIGEYQEAESGKKSDRPELARAMERCRLTGATLLIAKLDRLSRNVHFLSGLMEQKVPFVACDMPDANGFTVHIMAAVAQHEREAISARTTAALGSIKAKLAAGERHVSRKSGRVVARLGNPNGLKVRRADLGTETLQRKADEFASGMLPTIRAVQGGGATSLAQIAERLTELRVKTARGGSTWTPTAVKRVLDRAKGRPREAAPIGLVSLIP